LQHGLHGIYAYCLKQGELNGNSLDLTRQRIAWCDM